MKHFKKEIIICLLIILIMPGFLSFAGGMDSLPREQGESSRKLLKGYIKEISGETIAYHSPLPAAKHSLLVRSLDKKRYIEWEMEPVPVDYKGDYVTYVWLAAIDVNADSHNFDLYIDDSRWFSFANPLQSEQKHWHLEGKKGAELDFLFTMIDRHDDLFGYMFLKFPTAVFKKGIPPKVRIVGESAGSRSWFMVFKNGIEQHVSFHNEPAVRRGKSKDKHTQQVRVDILHLRETGKAAIYMAGKKKIESNLTLGIDTVRLPVPMVGKEKKLALRVDIDGKKAKEELFTVKPLRKRKIYLIHHSHVDIGYTHLQPEVEQKHWQYFEQAIDLGKRTKDYPEGARFKWNVEVMWAVDSYLRKTAGQPEKKQRFIDAVKQGWIELDATYANELTGLCRPEELMRLFESARDVGQKCGVKVEAAMITDIPGAAWGLVPALAQNGVKYLAFGSNHGHRIGHILSTHADRPFYWVSPSGREKVLCWVAGKGYAYFHTGLGYSRLKKSLDEKHIFAYLSELQEADYPYDIVPLHYCIGSDNGPPDPQLPDKVKKWNEKYLVPQLVIATVSETFREFEQQYGSRLPVMKGDFTGCWEDGAASSARETALNRCTAERLVQAETLWTMVNPETFPVDKFREAWRSVLLFSEHTWGSWNSISEPEADFTRQQWRVKQAFAAAGERLSKELLRDAQSSSRPTTKSSPVIDIINTNSWYRDDLVLLSPEQSAGFDLVKDAQGNNVPCQRLSTGELAILVNDIPPLGAKRFFLETKRSLVSSTAFASGGQKPFCKKVSGLPKTFDKARSAEMGRRPFWKSFCPAFFKKGSATPTHEGTGNPVVDRIDEKACFLCKLSQGINKKRAAGGENGFELTNSHFYLRIDKNTGAISSLKYKKIKHDLVDRRKGLGLNDYFYVSGRKPDEPQRNGSVRIRIKEQGPLVNSLLIEAEAPGCRSLLREVRLIEGLDRVDIIDTIDKKKIIKPEGVHIAFPFDIPGGVIRIDAAWGIFRPELDQLPGSCKNYFSIQRWVDISNRDYGVTLTAVDAPLIEIGTITTDAIAAGWLEHIEPSQTLYSYVMNNYWETNYKASQEGITVFRYALKPHREFDPTEAKRFGIEQNQPLIAVPVDHDSPPLPALFGIEPAAVILTSLKPSRDGKGMLLRLFNTGETPAHVKIKWAKLQPQVYYHSSPFGESGRKIEKPFVIPASGIVTLRVEL